MAIYHAYMPLAALPGPGDVSPGSLRDWNVQRLRAQLDRDLKHALIRGHFVDWGHGGRPELAADALHSSGMGNEHAQAAWQRLHSALANGSPDAEVLTHLRRWWAVCRVCCVDDLADNAMDGRRVAFPERAR